MKIRRLVGLRTHQGWSDKILQHKHPVLYYGKAVIEYEAGDWGIKKLYEAEIGTTYAGETANINYESELMSEEEYTEWCTFSGVKG